MNQTFSLTRFARLNSWFWAIKGRTYLFGTAIFLIVTVLVLSPVLFLDATFSSEVQESHVAYFLMLSLLLTSSLGSDVFSALFRQESAIAYLMIPASRTEKFWLGTLYCLVALLFLTVFFFGYEAITFSVANARLPAGETDRYVSSVTYYKTHPHNVDAFWLAIPVYTLLLSLPVAWLGSFFFRRGVFVRNVGVGLVAGLGLIFFYVWLVRWQFGGQEVGTSLPFFGTSVYDSGVRYTLSPPGWLVYLAYGSTLVGLWIIARIRFNELER